MTYKLDHVIVHVENLETGIEVARASGLNAFFGGVHASGTTHNALICFADGSYEELMALTGNPASETAAMDFSPLLKGKPEGVVGWAVASTDLDADIALLRARGVPVGEPTPGQRKRADGVLIQWRLVWLPAKLPIMLIQDVTPRTLRVPDDPERTTQGNGTRGIEALVLPLALDELALFPALFGKSDEQVGGDKVYALDGSSVILTALVQMPEIRLRQGATGS